MKKFKNKKTGVIATQLSDCKDFYITSITGDSTIHKRNIEDNNHWEEVKEKEYEILSFINKNNQVFEKTWQSKYPLYHYFYITNGFFLEEILTGKDNTNRLHNMSLRSYESKVKDQEFKIYSVKRLSDGEVFTIGDKVGINRPWIIKEFTFVNFGTTEDILSACDEKGGTYISQLVKFVGKQPLFKTEDGIDIFEGDSYYPITEEFVICNKCTYPTGNKMFKLFSTKKAAEEYILMNKHCLSIKDVLHNVPNNAAYDFMKHRLQELVKQKLK